MTVFSKKYIEYSAGVNPCMPQIQPRIMSFDPCGITRVSPIDFSENLGVPYRATTPNCLVSFITLQKHDKLILQANATSNLFVVISGKGVMRLLEKCFHWGINDVIAVPGTDQMTLEAEEDAVLYWVNDEPLLNFLDVVPRKPTFEPELYPFSEIQEAACFVNQDKEASKRNRNGVLLTRAVSTLTKTVTPTLWALFNVINPGEVQPAHRHQSVALDFCMSTESGAYTLMSQRLDEKGQLINPVRMDWSTGKAFITPPGWWHSHHNESVSQSVVFPVQDAGLHMYMRTLDIRFTEVNKWRER